MPKRIIDGEGLWRSDKFRSLDVSIRAEYANLIPLAMSNGVFECGSVRIWSMVYSFNRPEVSPEMVRYILDELSAGGLLFRWRDGGKIWGYFVGIDKPGRLPGVSRQGTHEIVGPQPPPFEVQEYIEETRSRNGFVYFIQGEITRRYKIGYSRSPLTRIELHQCGSPDRLFVRGLMVAEWSMESKIHRKFARDRVHGEWFEPSEMLEKFILEQCSLESMDSVGDEAGIPAAQARFPCLGFGLDVGTGSGNGLGKGGGGGTVSKHVENEVNLTNPETAAAFTAIGFDLGPFGHKPFQEVWTRRFKNKSGEWLTQVMEEAIQECQQNEIKIPPQFYTAKHRIQEEENALFNQKYRTAPL
jgi:Meiotically up-regulated gene 113